MAQLTDEKREAIRNWEALPCGWDGGLGASEGSPEFYANVDSDRYERYAPWLPDLVRFERFSGTQLLEIGCGLETDLERFGRNGALTIGIDLVPRHLELARRRFRNSGLPVSFVRSDAERLPFGDETFDVVYSFGVLHHTSEMKLAIDEIHRVLRPGGVAIIAIYHRFSLNLVMFLVRELVQGRLFRESISRTMGRIEGGGRTGAAPLVTLTSRWRYKRMLSAFGRVAIEIRHLQMPARIRLPRLLHRALERRFGWYLVAECRK